MTMTKSNQTVSVITKLSFTSIWEYNVCSHSLVTLSQSSMGSNVGRSNLTQLIFTKIQATTIFHCTRFLWSRWYSYDHGISSVILLSIRKKCVCSLSFIVIMTDIQNFCDRNSVTHNKIDDKLTSMTKIPMWG
jgi:hypothetical protein